MAYLYRLLNEYTHFLQKSNSGHYLPVKKQCETKICSISRYSCNEYGEGVFGWGTILSKKSVKSSELKVDDNELMNRNYYQVKVHLDMFNSFPLVDIYYLRHFPAYNQKSFEKPYNPYTLNFCCNLNEDINFITKHSRDFSPMAKSKEKSLWKYIHLLRDRYIPYNWDRAIASKIIKKCRICGKEHRETKFFEFHDPEEVDFDKEYKPVDGKDSIVVCPNCHKELHLRMRNEHEV
jgi:hypothetical protein